MCKIRQVAPSLSGIREDHKARYQFAIDRLANYKVVLDLGCGVGYGAFMMARAGLRVVAIDKDEATVEYAKRHYAHPLLTYFCAKMEGPHLDIALAGIKSFDKIFERFSIAQRAITAFEILEHVPTAFEYLERCSSEAKLLLGSVPNEDVVPFRKGKVNPEHYRHFTSDELEMALNKAGWGPFFLGSQMGKVGDQAQIVTDRPRGRTLVFDAEAYS